MLVSRLLLALGLLLALAVPALGQHEHGDSSGIVISHDVPADGRTYVGDLSHFGVLDLGTDLVPDFHQQNHIRVTENGVVLFETTDDSGHDYDGVNTFTLAFPAEGDYMVETLNATGAAQTMFMGQVHRLVPKTLDLAVEAPASVAPLTPAHIVITPSVDGKIANHTDSLVEVRQGAALLLRSHTHTHLEKQELDVAFPAPGTYTLRVTGYLSYPSSKAVPITPVTVEKTIMVSAGVPAPIAGPSLVQPVLGDPQNDRENAVVMGTTSGGNYTLVGTYDPYVVVAPGTQQHIDLLVMDPITKAPLQHVNFEAEFGNPAALLFRSSSLHEYDGIYEFTAVEQVPGEYVLHAIATYGPWSGEITVPYIVAPPVTPAVLNTPPTPAAGVELLSIGGFDGIVAGKTANLTLDLKDPAGFPLSHSEVDVQVVDERNVAVLETKLHTHDGHFAFRAAFPAGTYTLRLSPFPQDLQPVVFAGATPTAPLELPFTVAAGPGFSDVPIVSIPASMAPSHDSPFAVAPMVGLLLLGLASRRQ